MNTLFIPLENKQNNRSAQSNTIDRHLNQKIDFSDKKVALSYIHFYDTFYNISNKFNNNKIKYVYDNIDYEINFPDGTYTYKDFNNYLHFKMRNNNHYDLDKETGIENYPIDIVVNSVYSCLSVVIHEGFTLVIESDGISRFLGIDLGKYENDFNSQKIPDITMGFDTMFVHCNIVDNSIIPEYNSVIFTCPMNRKFGEHINITPNEKRYLNCNNSNTQNIKIWLTNQDGIPIEFVENKWGIGLDVM